MTATLTVDQRRGRLRELAETDPGDLALLVHLTPGVSVFRTLQAWHELTLDVARLADLGNGLEWREVVPGAPPSQGYTIAAEVLEESIADALDVLCGGAS